MPQQDIDCEKALLYPLWDSLSIKGYETESLGEYDNGLVLGNGRASCIRELIESLSQTSQYSSLAVIASEHLIDEISQKNFDSLDLIKYPEDGLLKWTSNPSWWQEVFEKKFDSIFFLINQKSLLAVENILEILVFAETEATIRFIDHDGIVYLLSQSECSAALNSILEIDEWTGKEFPPIHTKTQPTERQHLLFDCRVLGEKAQTGINRYANELLKTMPTLLADTEIRAIGCSEASVPEGVTKIPLSLPLNDPWRAGKLLGVSSALEQSDLIFSPYYPVPEKRNGKAVLTIHDLIPLVHPEWFANPATIRFFEKDLRESARCADKIIAVSYCTKKDIIKFYEIEDDKIEVIHLAPSSIFKEKTHTNYPVFGNCPNIPKDRPYFLSVATLEPRKNLVRTIKAFELFRDREEIIKPSLILVGQTGWKNEELLETFNNSKYKDSIIFTGYLKDEDLTALYQQALAFIYPSLYEGFGLPVLEAMACGVPVITSNNSSLAEIANDSALCCDPYSIDEIAQSMQKISESQALRNELAAAGIKKANEFSWEKTAKETAKVLLSCLN